MMIFKNAIRALYENFCPYPDIKIYIRLFLLDYHYRKNISRKNLLKNRIRSILNKRIILMRLCVEREIYNEYLILF